MKIFSELPNLVAKPKHGSYLVTAVYFNGMTNSVSYIATNPNEAKYKYLVEFGKVQGEIKVKFLEERA